MQPLSGDEQEALDGLRRGDPLPLATLLQQPRYRMHPLIQSEILDLINGPVGRTRWRMRLVRHPALGTKRPEVKRQTRQRDLSIALFFERELDANGGNWTSAVAAAQDEFNVGRVTVTNAIQHKKGSVRSFAKFARAHGVLR